MLNVYNLIEKLQIRLISIDAPDLRKIVINKLSKVPCIVLISEDEMYIYEGEDCFTWVAEQIEQIEDVPKTEQPEQNTTNMKPSDIALQLQSERDQIEKAQTKNKST